MTGPEHYAKAEEHLGFAAGIETDGHDDSTSAWHQRQAQVHATLAAAEATIAAATMRPEGCDEWDQATGRLEVTPLCGPT